MERSVTQYIIVRANLYIMKLFKILQTPLIFFSVLYTLMGIYGYAGRNADLAYNLPLGLIGIVLLGICKFGGNIEKKYGGAECAD